MRRILFSLLTLFAICLPLVLFQCKPDWKQNSGDPFTKAYWENRLLENDIVAYPRFFLVEGRVTGLYQSPLTIRSSTDGTTVTLQQNGSFSMFIYGSPKYFQIEFPGQPTEVHCQVTTRGAWDGFKIYDVLITCPFAKTVVSSKTILWDRCTHGSTWNPFGNQNGDGFGDCSFGSATPLRFCTTEDGYDAVTNPNACNNGSNALPVAKGEVYQSCQSQNQTKIYQRENWRIPLFTEMFSVIRCSETNSGVITGEDGCTAVGNGTKYAGATADPILFPNAVADHYWGPQTFPAGGDIQVTTVNFNPGNEAYLNKDLPAYVRCVSDL
ncbi:DUF1566 domain-containing protein [Leptospira yanagawae]|uniref:DUF1566 domain-containing protein n=1 Tax=Leptospira yanagawae TaxID=293069 RepID=A0ABY2LYT1_9LEPT|nr:DUF1566 domain-containing protein [Leptospira yanagawae]TGL18906.1 DUF1566 domain-containing protein [Leptospira yanagawae]